MAVQTSVQPADLAGGAAARHRRRRLGPRAVPYLLVAPAVIYLLGITLYPFIAAVENSLYEESVGQLFYVGFENYARLFGDPAFWNSLVTTGTITAGALALEAGLGMGLALLIHKDPWVRTWRILFLTPMLFMPSAVAFMWKLLFFPGTSVINDLLLSVGLIDGQIDWLGDAFNATVMLIVTDVWQWTPFLFVIFLAGMQATDVELEEAAQLDGARWYHIFWFITLPLMRPIITVALILRGIDLITMFTTVHVMTKGGPAGYTETVSYFIYRTAFKDFQQGYAASASVVVLILTLLIAAVAVQRLFKHTS
jgi:multiple sugar transport system permease protein